MKLKTSALVLGSALTLFSASFAFAADKAQITVNGQAIPSSQVENLVRAQIARGAPDTPELRNAVQGQLVNIELLAQEAKKRGLDKKPEVQAQLAMLTKEFLQQVAIDDQLRSQPLSETEIKAEYDRIAAQNAGRQEYSVRHILVGTEAEAKDLIKRLAKGEKFAELAKLSKDTGNANTGGDMGWQVPQNFVPAFGVAMTKLTKGQYTTEPVKTEFGYHVVQVDDIRALPIPDYDKLKPEIQTLLLRQRVANYIRDLRSKAKIQVGQ